MMENILSLLYALTKMLNSTPESELHDVMHNYETSSFKIVSTNQDNIYTHQFCQNFDENQI